MGLTLIAGACTIQQYDNYVNSNTINNIISSHGYALLTIFSFMKIFQKLFFNDNLDSDYERVKHILDTYFNIDSDDEEEKEEKEDEEFVEEDETLQNTIETVKCPVNTSENNISSNDTTDNDTTVTDDSIEMY